MSTFAADTYVRTSNAQAANLDSTALIASGAAIPGQIRTLNFMDGLNAGPSQILINSDHSETIAADNFHEHVDGTFNLQIGKDWNENVQGVSTLVQVGGSFNQYLNTRGNESAATVYEAPAFFYEFRDVHSDTTEDEKSYHFGDRTVFRYGNEDRLIYSGTESSRTLGPTTLHSTGGVDLSTIIGAQWLAKEGTFTMDVVNGLNLMLGYPLHIQIRPGIELNFNTISQVIARQEALVGVISLDMAGLKLVGEALKAGFEAVCVRFNAICLRWFGIQFGVPRVP